MKLTNGKRSPKQKGLGALDYVCMGEDFENVEMFSKNKKNGCYRLLKRFQSDYSRTHCIHVASYEN